MNKVILIGRLTADPELRYTPSGAAVCSFRIAVDRPFNSQSGEREADFINIVVWNKAAENTAKYMSKGRQIAVEGRLQIRSYVATTVSVVGSPKLLQTASNSSAVVQAMPAVETMAATITAVNHKTIINVRTINSVSRQHQPIMVWALSAPKSASVTKICRSDPAGIVRD